MIKARRLFLSPVISILFVSWIPVVGIPLCLIFIIIWYLRNQTMIHDYFKGLRYEQKDISKETIELSR